MVYVKPRRRSDIRSGGVGEKISESRIAKSGLLFIEIGAQKLLNRRPEACTFILIKTKNSRLKDIFCGNFLWLFYAVSVAEKVPAEGEKRGGFRLQ